MSGSTKGGAGALIAVVLIGIAIAFLGLRTQRVVTESAPVYAYDPETQGDLGPIVVSTTSSGGFSLFGLQLSPQDHTVSVRFLAAPGCSDLIATEEGWPPSVELCQTPYPVFGTIDGLGTAPNGQSLIGVAIPVTAECAEAVEPGSVWAPPIPPCAAVPRG